MKIQPKKNILMLCLLYFVSFISFALPYGYMQTFLVHVGYDVVERGVILSGTALVAIVFQFVAGYLCDKFKTDKLFYNLLIIAFVVTTYVMYQVTSYNFFLHLIFMSLVGGIFRTVNAVQDAWCLETDDDCKNNYGPIRAFGAIGWMIGSPIGAWIIAEYGYPALGIVFAGLSIVNVIITMFMQDATKHEKAGGIKISDLKQLLLNKRYVIIVLIFLVVNIIAIADTYTMVDKMMALGAQEGMVGARWSIQAFMELPLFFAGGYLLKKFGDYKLMVFGTIMYILRFVLYAVVQSPEMMVAVSLLQCVTFPLIMITSKTLVDDTAPAALRASGQTIASAIYIGVSLLVTPMLSGVMVNWIGIDMTLLVIGLFGIFALLLAGIYKKI